MIAAFGTHFAKTGKVPVHFHSYLIRSHDQRLAGDYNYTDLPTLEDAELQIARAEEFLNYAEHFLSGK